MAETKFCPRCVRDLPYEAFRKSKGKPLGLDSYCKKCRREQREANLPRERARWNRYRKNKGAEYYHDKYMREPEKQKARDIAKKVHPEAQPCSVKRCKSEGYRHHHDYSKPEDIVWLCGVHHARIHKLERARRRTGPSWL